jgi:hypothetical protein
MATARAASYIHLSQVQWRIKDFEVGGPWRARSANLYEGLGQSPQWGTGAKPIFSPRIYTNKYGVRTK